MAEAPRVPAAAQPRIAAVAPLAGVVRERPSGSVKAAEEDPARGQAAAPRTALADADAAQLIDAFVRGAGLAPGPAWPPSTLTAEWMQHLGRVMRAGTEGTLALLNSRAATKREIHAEGTRIAPRQNNPLKFAPDATEALTQLLRQTGARGFLDPVEALRDAHDDLLIHQVAMAAGMRAALLELISRLGPEAIESEAGPATGLARHVPPLRDAALWRRLRERHAHLLEHLDDEFEMIFGREFLSAYEAQARNVDRKAAPPSAASDAGPG